MQIPVYVLRCKEDNKSFLTMHKMTNKVCFGPVGEAFQFNYESLAKHYQEMHPEMNLELCILKYIVLPVKG